MPLYPTESCPAISTLVHTFESPISYIELPLAVTALDPYITPISTLICSAGSIGYEASAYEQEA